MLIIKKLSIIFKKIKDTLHQIYQNLSKNIFFQRKNEINLRQQHLVTYDSKLKPAYQDKLLINVEAKKIRVFIWT